MKTYACWGFDEGDLSALWRWNVYCVPSSFRTHLFLFSQSLNDFLNNLAIRILSFHLHSFSVVRCHWGVSLCNTVISNYCKKKCCVIRFFDNNVPKCLTINNIYHHMYVFGVKCLTAGVIYFFPIREKSLCPPFFFSFAHRHLAIICYSSPHLFTSQALSGWMGQTHFQVSPEIFDWVQAQALAGPLKDINSVVSKPLLLCALLGHCSVGR